jgi:hypothetical protein
VVLAAEPLVHLIEADTCPQAWLKAVEYLSRNHDAAYNLVLAVRRPEVLTPADFAIHDVVDGFLREHGRPPLSTIAGTIFPANFYLHGGTEELYTYPQIYPRIPSQWGTYAIRMLRKSTYRKGNGQAEINPLRVIVEKMKKQLAGGRMRAVYEANLVEDTDYLELPIYDAECDARGTRSQPCLSHLSFKLLPRDCVMLTVLYRYHYYVEKALGNLLGLSQLLYFVAEEPGLESGRSCATLRMLSSIPRAAGAGATLNSSLRTVAVRNSGPKDCRRSTGNCSDEIPKSG